MYDILLVDDERLELDTLKNYVSWDEMGFRIVGTAKNGKEALAKTRELLPDIVITDVKMPLMDGVEFAGIARGLLPRLKIVFLSGYDDFAYVKSALQVEASGYLLKPLNIDELRSLMEKVKRKCEEERRSALSARALAVQYVRDLLHERDPEACKSKAEDIRRLALEPLHSSTEEYALSLVTIDEYRMLTEHEPGGEAVIADIRHALDRLAAEREPLLVPVNDREYALISFREPLEDAVQWNRELGAAARWITFCSSPRPSRLERLSEAYRELLAARNAHVFRHGPGHFIAADRADDPAAYGHAAGETPGASDAEPAIAQLHACVRQGDAAGTGEWIAAFMERRMALSGGHMEPVMQAALDLVDRLYAEHVTPFAGMKERLEDKSALVGRLSVCESGPGLERALGQWLRRLTDEAAMLERDAHAVTVRRLQKLIGEQFARPLSIDDLAEQVYMSPNYLRTIFKEHTGSTVLEYMTEVRMERAAELLRNSALKIHEISARVGYENPSHFCAIFLRKRGTTPNQYRKQTLRL